MWVIGVGGNIGVGVGGIVGRTNVACKDPVQPRFGRISFIKPQSDYLSVPDVRKKCYKIPPENELCLCEDIFQQHQAKLVNCDVEDASAVESYKEPTFDSNENVCNDSDGNECCCNGGNGSDDCGGSSSSTQSSSVSGRSDNHSEDAKKCSGAMLSVAASKDMALEIVSGGSGGGSTSGTGLKLAEKLTAKEREKVLQELDDLMTGNFLTKVRRFSQDVQSESSDDQRYRVADQSGQLTTSVVAATTSKFRGKRSSSLDTDEIVNYGKMAELTRRFSRLGETDIMAPQHYCSEPNFFGETMMTTSARHLHRRYHDDEDSSCAGDGSSGDDYEFVRQPIQMVFIRPMSVSDDRLNSRSDCGGGESGGVVLTEVTSDGEDDLRHQQQQHRTLLSATQNRRRSFRKSLAFDSSLSSIDDGAAGGGNDLGVKGSGDSGDEATTERYRRLKGGWQSVAGNRNWQSERRRPSQSSDTVCVSTLGRTHRRYSSVDVYDQVKNMFLDVEKTEKEFRDGLLAEKNRRRVAIQEYLANKELLLMKMKSASTGGILRWNQEHQDTLLDDEEPWWPNAAAATTEPSPPPLQPEPSLRENESSPPSSDVDSSPKDVLRRVLRTGLKGRRIRRLRKLESRSSGFATLADLWRVSRDEPPSSSTPRHSAGCSSAEPPDNHIYSL